MQKARKITGAPARSRPGCRGCGARGLRRQHDRAPPSTETEEPAADLKLVKHGRSDRRLRHGVPAVRVDER